MQWGGALQSLAQTHRVCILAIYHTRKAEADDPLDEVMGTTGLTGAVDAALILRRGRGQADATLMITGRDVEEQELALKFHPAEGLWELLGTVAERTLTQEHQEILAILKESGPQTTKELAKLLEKSFDTVRITLKKMRDAGLVRFRDDGRYEL